MPIPCLLRIVLSLPMAAWRYNSCMRTKGTAKELEARRRIAGSLLQQGKSRAEVAKLVGASWRSVARWKKAIGKGGLDALAAKPHPGAKPKLTNAKQQQLLKVLQRGAWKSGYETNLWTCRRIAEVIEKRFGVKYDTSHVWRLLYRRGWSCQKPMRRPREQDRAAVEAWIEQDWPRIKKGARRTS